MKNHVAPRFPRWILECFLSPEHDSVVGDLEEEYFDRAHRSGRALAAFAYWLQTLKLIPSLLIVTLVWSFVMLRNYLKIGLRNLYKYKGYSLINISGLAVGMTCCMLILLFVQDELKYDRFHEQADRIYRLVNNGRSHVGVPWAPAIEQEFPEVEHAVRILDSPGGPTKLVAYGEKRFVEERFFYADQGVFEVFSWPLLEGNPTTALRDPFSVVITSELARKYFGEAEALGKVLKIDDEQEFRITGVVQELPRHSHIKFDLLASMATVLALDAAGTWGTPLPWTNPFVDTYLLLKKADPASVEEKLPGLLVTNLGKDYRGSIDIDGTRLQPITEIHLNSGVSDDFDPQGSMTYVYLLSTIAVFILLIACINFMNLATARSQKRAIEAGMRKVMGAFRAQLIRQFLGESLLISFFALALGASLLSLVLPAFNGLTGKALEIDYIDNWPVSMIFIVVAALVGIAAGSYPALFLSAAKPAEALKSGKSTTPKGVLLRKSLVVFQFVISTILITGTAIVYQQLDYLRSTDLGFEKEQVVVMPFRGSALLRQRTELFKQKVLQHRNILKASASHSLPGHWLNRFNYLLEGAPAEERIGIGDLVVDHDFIEMFGMEVVAGRAFSKAIGGDSAAFILNEQAVKKFGFPSPEEAVGQRIEWLMGPGRKGSVIGVVRDFHFHSLHRTIPAMVIHITDWSKSFLSVRIAPNQVKSTLAFLEETWQELDPVYPFQYYFFDEDFANRYESEEKLGQVFGNFAALAIFIGCLGLFGLASFTSQQRSKEIGVRKVLGASVVNLLLMLSKDFAKLIAIAIVVASPLAYLAMDWWLREFAYRISIGPLVFVLAAAIAFVVAWLTVGYHALKAAMTNPVESLRYE